MNANESEYVHDRVADAGRPSVSPTEVAVAVVSWNTKDLLRRCLASLRADAEQGFVRVIVVDNGSKDESGAMVREEFGWAALIEPAENLGFGRAVNLGLRQAPEPWIVAANADIEVYPGATRALVDALRASPTAGLAAPRLVMPDGRTQHSVHAFPGIGLGLAVNAGLVDLIPRLGDRLCIEGRWNPDRARRVPWAHGAFLMARRDVFEQVGGFDERQWMYAEDIDLAWRMRKAGWSCLYRPEALIRHEVSAATTVAFADERLDRHLDAAFDWMIRRRGRLVARTYAGLNWLGAGLRAVITWPLAWKPEGRHATAHARYRRFAAVHGSHLFRRSTPGQVRSATFRGR